MLLKPLREEVLEANLELVRHGLVLYTFGNASGVSRPDGLVVIKPSGMDYDKLGLEDMVITDMEGNMVEGPLRPSSDLPTHLALYNSFPHIGGVVHTHSEFATAWAQACRSIPCFGTTHADYFHGAVPVTNRLSEEEIANEYEKNTGISICRAFAAGDAENVPAALVAGHGPFTWGPTAAQAAHHAVILESVARVAYYTLGLAADVGSIAQALQDKHYLRKHGNKAYYGQVSGK